MQSGWDVYFKGVLQSISYLFADGATVVPEGVEISHGFPCAIASTFFLF